MSVPSAEQPKTLIDVGKGATVNVFHLAGQAQESVIVLFLPPNGFHIKCHAPLVRAILSALHGFGTCLRSISTVFLQARYLAPHALCIGIDFRGQGNSLAPDPAEQLVEAYMHDLLAVVKALKLQGLTEQVGRDPDLHACVGVQ